jgi:hypothetical protein
MDEPRWEGYDPPDNRRIIFANDDGKLYEFGILSFVILQTSRMLTADVPKEQIDIDELTTAVSEAMGSMAKVLVIDGWFTEEEYLAAFAKEHSSGLDDELRDLLEDK